MKEVGRKNKIEIISYLAILVIICLLLSIFMFSMLAYEKLRANYYKDQMLSFCYITQVYQEDTFPEMYPCEQWLLSSKGRK